ncbi:MAG: glycosyltransferase family 2 protein [Verrucomicrobia bacterium]|nr:glycosyltransferase family 2 protein [Verrucomicrobiota bacterium]MBV9657055.1 glycosyltransferase family 2 protein [Verrucomicrobiota bacterium]
MSVAALIPAYCEEKFIANVVARTLAQQPGISRVLVVDDGSPDRTAELARAAGAEVIVHETNAGKGAAVQTGLRRLQEDPACEWIVMLDADGQHRPEEIGRFLDAAQQMPAARLFIGTRMSDTRTMPLVRRLTNRFMSAQISLLCGQRIADTQCGFRLLHRTLIPLLLDRAARFDYETEMLIVTSWRGEKIADVPVSTVYGEETSSIHPLRDTGRFFKLMGRYWLRRWRQREVDGNQAAMLPL